MGRKQAVIMEVGRRTATVLQQDGSFSKVPRHAGMAVGDVISLPAGKRRPWTTVVTAAAMILAMLYTSFIVLPANRVMAYVTVDTAPGVELAVNSRGKVVGSTAVNAEGEHLLASLPESVRDLTDALARLTNAALAAGYVSENSEVVVMTVSPSRNGIKNSLLAKIEQLTDEAVQQVLRDSQRKAEVERIQLTPELREEARKEGISAGQYAIALKAADAGINVSLDELRKENVVQVLKRKGVQPNDVIREIKEEESLNGLMERNRGKLQGNRGSEQPPPDAGSNPTRNTEPGRKESPGRTGR